MIRIANAFLAAFMFLSLPPIAAAQEDAEAEARARFEAGRTALAAGHAESALADFRAAYALSPRPELLYNVGVAADRVRHDAEALEAFERYLAEMPPDQITNRAEVEARIATLRETIARQTAPVPAAASVSAPDPAPTVLLAVGGAVVVAGAVALAFGSIDRASVQGAPRGASWSDYADAASRAPILEGVGGALLGVGAALVIVGGILLGTTTTATDLPLVSLRTRGLGLSIEGAF